MKKRNILRSIIFIAVAVLLFAGSFSSLSKTAYASGGAFIDSDVEKKDDGKKVQVFTVNGLEATEADIDGLINEVLGEDKGSEDDTETGDDTEEGEPRMCKNCGEKECMEGQDYCFECYSNIQSAKVYVDLMLEMEKKKAENAEKQAETQAEIDKLAKEQSTVSSTPSASKMFIPVVLTFAMTFCIMTFLVFLKKAPITTSSLYDNDNEDEEPDEDEPMVDDDDLYEISLEDEGYEISLEGDGYDISLVPIETEVIRESGEIELMHPEPAQKPVQPEPEKETKQPDPVIAPVAEPLKTETKVVSEDEKVLDKKAFLDCLKQQTTSYRSGDPFAVCTTDTDDLFLMHYYHNNFVLVKVAVEDNGKLKVVYDYRRKFEFFIEIEHEFGKDSLKIHLKSSKGNEADFVIRPVVRTKIKGYTIDYNQTKDYATISNGFLPNYIQWIRQNAVFEEEKNKGLSNQELKERIKKLDPAEKAKFVEPAKNGKTDEAIKACHEVMGLGLKDAKKIIDMKLYY